MDPGSDLLALMASARDSVVLAAPFMTLDATRRVLRAVPESVADVTLVTRWRPDEVAAGVSDLAVLDLVAERAGAKLLIHPRLHAKVYRSDGRSLIGSANLTGTALGWAPEPNVEVLAPPRDEEHVSTLVEALRHEAYLATAEIRDVIAAHVPASAPSVEIRMPWLPCCHSPAELWNIYSGAKIANALGDAPRNGRSDLKALGLPRDVCKDDFAAAVSERFLAMPVVSRILVRMSDAVTDQQGIDLLTAGVPREYLPFDDAHVAWDILKRWLKTFGNGEFRSKAVGEVLVRGRVL